MAKQYSLDQYRYISNSKKMRALDIPKYALHNLQSCSLAVLQSCSLCVDIPLSFLHTLIISFTHQHTGKKQSKFSAYLFTKTP